MPVARRATNSETKPVMARLNRFCGSSWPPGCCGSMARQAGVATSTGQPDDIADQHQQRRPPAATRNRSTSESAGRRRCARRSARRWRAICQPYQVSATQKTMAARLLNTSSHRFTPARHDVEHEVRPDVAVGAHQLARDDHDRPDHEIDDDLLGKADRVLRREVARHHLPQRKQERRQAREGRRSSARRDPTASSSRSAFHPLQPGGEIGRNGGHHLRRDVRQLRHVLLMRHHVRAPGGEHPRPTAR